MTSGALPAVAPRVAVDPIDSVRSRLNYVALCAVGRCSIQRLVNGRIMIQYEDGRVATVLLAEHSPICLDHGYTSDGCAGLALAFANFAEVTGAGT